MDMDAMGSRHQQQQGQDLPLHSLDPDEEMPRVLLALQTVYAPNVGQQWSGVGVGSGSGIAERRDVADQYLTSFQRAAVAWVVCDRLLLSSDVTTNDTSTAAGKTAVEDSTLRTQRQFFAAQTLHAKCLGDVYQLPPSSLPSLRDSLLNHFITHASEAVVFRPLVTRLSMAIASLAAQMHWHTCLTDVTNNILTPHPELGPAVLELFRSIPEEADSNRLVMSNDDDLWNYRDVLRNSSHVVLGLCEHAVQSVHRDVGTLGAAAGSNNSFSDVATTEAVLSCLQSWIRIVDMDPQLLQNTILLHWVFGLLEDSGNGGFELAVDVIVELLRAYPSDRRGVDGLVGSIIPRVMALGQQQPGGELSPFQKSIQEEDEDGMRGYCRIFTEMSESYLSLILSHDEMNQASLVELVLQCSSIPDKELAGITLHFWYRFVASLEELEPFEYRQEKIDSFAPQLHRLLRICTRLLRYPVNAEDLSPDRLDDVEGIRVYFADTVEDCCRLLGGEAVLRATGELLRDECGRVAPLPPSVQVSEWHGMEAYLYAIQAISLYVPPDEQIVIPFVMGMIPQLPGNVPLLRATLCQVVGKYSSWLARQPPYLHPLLPYLAHSLSVPRCAFASAVAIREICERCDALGDSVMQLYDTIVAAREQQEFILDVKNELAVLEGVCKAVSSKLVNEPSIIGHLAQPIISSLRIMASPQCSPSPKQIAAEICRLTVLVQHLRPPLSSTQGITGIGMSHSEFILGLMREIWPVLDAVSQKQPHDFNCGEKLCRLHKHALRECGAGPYTPMLDLLVGQTVKNFSLSLSSPYLYLASIIISEYGRDRTHSKLLYSMVASMSFAALDVLRTADDLNAHPDVVEELFFMAGRMVDHCPTPLVQSELLGSLLRCAGMGMKLHHRDANRGTLSFLESTASYGLRLKSGAISHECANARDDAVALERVILAEGGPLVNNLAQALLGDLPAYRLESGSGSVSGVLFYWSRLCPEPLMGWIGPPLAAAPAHARSAFLVMLSEGGTPREEFNSSVRKFSAVCERSQKRKK